MSYYVLNVWLDFQPCANINNKTATLTVPLLPASYVPRICVCVCPQFCLTMCNPMDYSPLGSSVYGIFCTRILEWVAISYSRGSSRPRDWTHISCIFCVGRWVIYHWGATWEAPKIMDHGIEIESDVWVHPRTCVVVFQSPNHVQLFVTLWTAARQASLSLTNSRKCPSSCPLNWRCHPTISSSITIFSFCFQSFPASGSLPMSHLFTERYMYKYIMQNTELDEAQAGIKIARRNINNLR